MNSKDKKQLKEKLKNDFEIVIYSKCIICEKEVDSKNSVDCADLDYTCFECAKKLEQ